MKKISTVLFTICIFCIKANSQVVTGNVFTLAPADVFTYNSTQFKNYGTGWANEPGISTTYGPTGYLSGFGSVKLITASAPRLTITFNGNVGIGTTNPGSYKLAVEGKIGAREVKVTLENPWADYVFDKSYKLRSIDELEKFTQKNNHLPGIPSSKEVKDNGGIDLGQMNLKLLEKVEELTLYVIQLKKENKEIKKEVKKLSHRD